MTRVSILAVAIASFFDLIPTYAAQVASSGTVGKISAYATYGSGDVVFTLSSNAATCSNGYWIKPTDPGQATVLSTLFAGKSTGASLQVFALDTDLWPGGTATCHVVYIVYLG